MDLAQAQRIANELIGALAPTWEWIEVTVRRETWSGIAVRIGISYRTPN